MLPSRGDVCGHIYGLSVGWRGQSEFEDNPQKSLFCGTKELRWNKDFEGESVVVSSAHATLPNPITSVRGASRQTAKASPKHI